MSLGFNNKDKIPGVETHKRSVPKAKKPKVTLTDVATSTSTHIDAGLLNERQPIIRETIPKRRMGRPNKIKIKDTITLTGEKESIDDFRKFCDTHGQHLSFVECLKLLVDNYKANNDN